MKIGLVMFYDNNVKAYGNLNYDINKKYCEKYNLQLIKATNKKYKNRHSAWERLPLLLEHISNFDYLIWIDADAFFYIDSSNITDIIDKNINFIFSKDIGNKNINSGFFIVKNSEYSIEFLKKWAYDEELFKINPFPVWWDQGVLIDMYNKNILDIQNNCIEYEYGVLQHFNKNDKLDKTYVYHLAGKSHEERIEASQNYLAGH